jgi:hypothetical protein
MVPQQILDPLEQERPTGDPGRRSGNVTQDTAHPAHSATHEAGAATGRSHLRGHLVRGGGKRRWLCCGGRAQRAAIAPCVRVMERRGCLRGPAQLVLQCGDFLLGIVERLLQQQRTLHQQVRRVRLPDLYQLIQKNLKNLRLLRTHGRTPLNMTKVSQ